MTEVKILSPGVVAHRKHETLHVQHTLEMRSSFAWVGLPDISRRILDRLEVEHLRHCLRKNGQLICTYDDFVGWGLRRKSLLFGLEAAIALGFLARTRHGFADVPTLYRLTYVTGADGKPRRTDDWREFKDKPSVDRALVEVREGLERLRLERARKRASQGREPESEAA